MRKYTPTGRVKHWCSFCDSVVVDSTKPDTGSFYLQYGHCYDDEVEEYDGDYIGVMFALCPACQPKERE